MPPPPAPSASNREAEGALFAGVGHEGPAIDLQIARLCATMETFLNDRSRCNDWGSTS